jgi:hypothetical protein
LGLTTFEAFLGVSQTIRFAVGFENVDPMGKAIKQGSCQPLASQDLGPFLEREVGGDNQAGPFVSPADHFEQKFGAGL